MPKILSVILLVVGGILLFYGLNASDSVSSNVSEAVTGAPTDRSIWLLVLGAGGVIAGLLGLFVRRAR